MASSSAAVPSAPPKNPDDDLSPVHLPAPPDNSTDEVSTFSHQRIMTTVQRTNAEGGTKGSEVLTPFKATPEVISQFLELKIDEVLAQMKSVEGREKLYAKLMEHEEDLKKIHDFNPEELRRQLEIAGEILDANEQYLKDVKSPEKKSAFRRAWDKMRGFAWRHPMVTALLLLVAVAGTGASIAYFSGSIESLMHKLGEVKTLGLTKPLKELQIEPGGGKLIGEGSHL